jgi:hypothetical protein
MAEMAVFGMFFEHLYTDVNSVGNRDIGIRDLSAAIPSPSVTSAPAINS